MVMMSRGWCYDDDDDLMIMVALAVVTMVLWCRRWCWLRWRQRGGDDGVQCRRWRWWVEMMGMACGSEWFGGSDRSGMDLHICKILGWPEKWPEVMAAAVELAGKF
ncbi:hypothetical protein Tco_1180297 [Tanacetum coccineum]